MKMTTDDRVSDTGMAIEVARQLIDNAMPQVQDLVPKYEYAKWAPLYLIAHSAFENGLKAILVKLGVRWRRGRDGHDLGKLLQLLRESDSAKAKLLENTFTDTVNFYTIDIGRWVKFQSLDTYLGEFGTSDRYETFRYWALEGRDQKWIPLFIHRELLVVLEKLCRWGIEQITSQRVEDSIRYSFVRGVEEHINNCDGCRKDSSKPWLKILNKSFPSDTPFSDRLRGVNSQDFEIVDDECLNQVIHTALDSLGKSEDPTVRYYIQTLNDLPDGSVTLPSDIQFEVEWPTDTYGIVKIRNGEKLGTIRYTIDSRWYAQDFFHKYNPRFAKTRDDAANWLLHACTVVVKVSVNGGEYTSRRAMSPPSPGGVGWDDPPAGHKITFANEAHGLSVGQHLNVRSGLRSALVSDGIISKVSGGLVEFGDEVP